MSPNKCRKCGGTLLKKGVMDSGNTKYRLWGCRACGFEDAEVVKEERKKGFSFDL